METTSLVNKTAYFMITSATGNEAELGVSVQKIFWKTANLYEISCIAAADKNVTTNDNRQGKYQVKEQSGNKMVLEVEEETGEYPGHYELTFHWLDANTGTLFCKNIENGASLKGVFQIIT